MDSSPENSGRSMLCDKPNRKKSKRRKDKKLPTTALKFYIKLYCKKKKGTYNPKNPPNMIEAIHSWLLLSEHEKQQFQNKYKECREKYFHRVVNYIHKAEPFMKRKSPDKSYSVDNNDQFVIDLQSDNNEENISQTVETLMEDGIADKVENKSEQDENPINEDIDMEQLLTDSLEIRNDQCNSQHETLRISYPEPMPPGLKTGKELFQMIMTMEKETESTWTSLSHKEKHCYNQAVLTLKRDYIKKYRQYLESLTVKELFDYYNKSFN